MDNMSDVLNDINHSIDNMFNTFKKLGVGEKAIDKLLSGHEIIECYQCHTPNMYDVHTQDGKGGWTIYECGECGKNHMELDYGKD